MPGSSLWLVPPADSLIANQLNTLIAHTIPSHFPHLKVPTFAPHVTLTSEIDPKLYADKPLQWLQQQIPYPRGRDLPIVFETLDTELPFFRKLTIRVQKHAILAQLAKECRAIGAAKDNHIAQHWVENDYRPHCSLMYGDTAIPQRKLEEVKEVLQDERIGFKDTVQPPAKSMDGWTGGAIWLVPTDKDISAWQPIAIRYL